MKLRCQAPNCGVVFESKRPAKTHSPACRKRLQRMPKAAASSTQTAEVVTLHTNPRPADAPATPPPAPDGVYTATLEALTKADLAGTPLGRNVLGLAHRLDNGHMETGAAYAALEKSFRAAYAEVMAGANEDGDELDDITGAPFQVIAGGLV